VQLRQGQAAHPGQIVKTFDKLRAAGGENVDFVLDGAAGLSPGVAGTICDALERFHLLWFDEPCPSLNVAAIQKLALERVTPLGFGRSIHSGVHFQDLLREGALDVLRPDIARNGITQIRRMAAMAETYYTAVAPYHDGGPIATAAALHLAASLPNFFIQQIPAPQAEEDIRMRASITGGSIETVKDGYAALPTGPGLGITVDEDVLVKYAERAA
jgi:galactonate dehydratase